MVFKFHRSCRFSKAFTLACALSASTVMAEPDVLEPPVKEVQKANKVVQSPLELTKAVRNSLPSVRSACVAINSGGFASGVIISKDGYVLTAGHVVKMMGDDAKLKITLENGESYAGKKLGYNEEND